MSDRRNDEGLHRALTATNLVKNLGGWVLDLVMAVFGVIHWVQGEGENRYFPKLAGENLEKRIEDLGDDIDKIEAQNNKMLELLFELKSTRGN